MLIGTPVLWFAVFRNREQPVVDQPPPKTTAELLVGSWKKVRPGEHPAEPALYEIIRRFKDDGKYELDIWNAIDGPRLISGTYRLDGNTLRFLTPVVDPSPIPHQEIWELVNTIESVTEEQLVIVTVTRKRWTPETAQTLANARDVPVEPILDEVREERSRTVYVRIKEQ